MKVCVTEFKAKCTRYLRELADAKQPIEVTNRGKVVAVVCPPPSEPAINPAWGALKGSVLEIAEDFDEPLGDEDWDAAR